MQKDAQLYPLEVTSEIIASIMLQKIIAGVYEKIDTCTFLKADLFQFLEDLQRNLGSSITIEEIVECLGDTSPRIAALYCVTKIVGGNL